MQSFNISTIEKKHRKHFFVDREGMVHLTVEKLHYYGNWPDDMFPLDMEEDDMKKCWQGVADRNRLAAEMLQK